MWNYICHISKWRNNLNTGIWKHFLGMQISAGGSIVKTGNPSPRSLMINRGFLSFHLV